MLGNEYGKPLAFTSTELVVKLSVMCVIAVQGRCLLIKVMFVCVSLQYKAGAC